MAVIQKIREKSWLLLVLIGLAMVLFVVDPSSINPRSVRNTKIAEVSGTGIEYEAYLAKLTTAEEFNKTQRGVSSLEESIMGPLRHQTLEELLQETILYDEYKKLGLGVHGDELFEMIQGATPDPIINQIFADQTTGVVDRVQLYNFLTAIKQDEGSQQKDWWLYIENIIWKNRLITKYNNLLSKGLYATQVEAEKRNIENNTSVDFSFVAKTFDEIPDSTISVSDSDLRKYYSEHKKEFKSTESRNIRYVTFTVVPSEEDYIEAEKWINNIKEEFSNVPVKETKQYINYNSDESFNDINYAQELLDDSLDIFAFSAEPGDVYGPYFEDNAYKLAKLTYKRQLPDSVKVRHILFTVNQNNFQQVRATADSLKEEIINGANFNNLASEFSADQQTSSTGGDLGWMTEETLTQNFGLNFKDSCFYNKTGHVFTMFSQFGIQIVQVSNQSSKKEKVQIGILAHEVTAGNTTDQSYYTQASEFAGKNNTLEKFNAAVSEGSFIAQYGRNISQTSTQVSGLEGSRSIVRWTFEAKQHDISSVFQIGENYIVAILDEVVNDGYQDFESVKESIRFEVLKEKKTEMLYPEVSDIAQNSNDIDDAAAKLETTVKNATNIRFRSSIIPDAGEEKSVVGAAIASNQAYINKAIKGRNGVYIISVEQKQDAQINETDEFSYEKRSIKASYGSRINYTINNILKELADVKDYRTKFF